MRTVTLATFALVGISALAAPAAAQGTRAGLMGDLLRDVGQVEQKVLALAEAMPADAYAWRPGEGVRSTAEVFQHIAADNWLLAGMAGASTPAFTNIDVADYSTVQAYEGRKASRDEILDHLRQSFAHLRKTMNDTPDAKLDQQIKMFGQDATVRGLWVMTTTHMHEHLGQLIAYARTNGVVPPWSRGG